MKKPRRKRWVVKAGSNMICSGGPLLLRAWMLQVASLRKDYKTEIIWVTSGAIASAVDRTGFSGEKRTLAEKQALSAIGQPLLMDLYSIALQAVGLMCGQILLTYDDMVDPSRRRNLQSTLNQLLVWDAVPVLNENDAVATEEIKFGDNDSLSAKVAVMMGADRLIMLTDVEGLYTDNPVTTPKAKRVSEISEVTSQWLTRVEPKAGSERGTGGMYSKLVAAREATSHGIQTWLVKGDCPNVLLEVAQNGKVGTRIGKA